MATTLWHTNGLPRNSERLSVAARAGSSRRASAAASGSPATQLSAAMAEVATSVAACSMAAPGCVIR